MLFCCSDELYKYTQLYKHTPWELHLQLGLKGVYVKRSHRYKECETNLKKVSFFKIFKPNNSLTFFYISNKYGICCASQLYKERCTKIGCSILRQKTRLEIL